MDAFQRLYNKDDICSNLNISLATVNNWIKTKVIPMPNKAGYYTSDVFFPLISSVKENTAKLTARANRSQLNESNITFLGIYDEARRNLLKLAINKFSSSTLSLKDGICSIAIAELRSNNLWIKNSSIYEEISKQVKNIGEAESFFDNLSIINYDDDFIGAFYQSIQSVATKANIGSYYTPASLLTDIQIPANSKIIDPCCGSGSILLHILDKAHNPNCVWARDIDEIALFICKVNLVLFFNNPNINPHIEYQDILFSSNQDLFSNKPQEAFDYIVTNPPWGSKFSKNQKEKLLSLYPELKTTEAFSIALYNSLLNLSKNGTLLYFLPQSFLNVAAHRKIRQYILTQNYKISITSLGHAFKGVQSECILLKIIKVDKEFLFLTINNGKSYKINRNSINAPDYFISSDISDNDYVIINKIFNVPHTTLETNSDFALGIVTGDNSKNVLLEQTKNSEPIYRGKDILPYMFKEPERFIDFKPEVYQQVAPLGFYRNKKIIYRFISDKIICMLDDTKALVLNSANIVISNVYPMETIVCLFNSPIYSFIYKKKFHSTKVLKSHLQSLPLPVFTEQENNQFKLYYNQIRNATITQQNIDKFLCSFFGINDVEYYYIKGYVDGRHIRQAIIEQYESTAEYSE